jgi:nucleoside-diphosphate-sugar epimerase
MHDVASVIEHLIGLNRALYTDAVFNLGGGLTTNILDMATAIAERCKVVANFRPSIVRPDIDAELDSPSLRYSCERIFRTGFKLKGSIEEEIDRTLYMSLKTWG